MLRSKKLWLIALYLVIILQFSKIIDDISKQKLEAEKHVCLKICVILLTSDKFFIS